MSKTIVGLFIFTFPFILLFIFGGDNIYAMLFSVNSSLTVAICSLLLLALNKKFRISKPGKRSDQLEKTRLFRVGRTTIRIILVGMALIAFWFMSIPVYFDTYDYLVRNTVMIEDGIILENDIPLGKGAFLMQFVRIWGKGKQDYIYFYSPNNILRVHDKYNLVILPRSKVILSAKHIAG